jgi:hypothetical protein
VRNNAQRNAIIADTDVMFAAKCCRSSALGYRFYQWTRAYVAVVVVVVLLGRRFFFCRCNYNMLKAK